MMVLLSFRLNLVEDSPSIIEKSIIEYFSTGYNNYLNSNDNQSSVEKDYSEEKSSETISKSSNSLDLKAIDSTIKDAQARAKIRGEIAYARLEFELLERREKYRNKITASLIEKIKEESKKEIPFIYKTFETHNAVSIEVAIEKVTSIISNSSADDLWNELKKESESHKIIIKEYRACRIENDVNNSISNCRIHAIQIAEIKGNSFSDMNIAMTDLINASNFISLNLGGVVRAMTHAELSWEQTKLLSPAHKLMVTSYRDCRLSSHPIDTVQLCRTYSNELPTT
jgi:hypothetical protein